MHELNISVQRVQNDIETLATFVDKSQPGWTRRVFTPPYLQARKWLQEQMEACGLEVEIDAASNLIGRIPGKRPELPPIMIGSHIDSVPGGGMFDGTIGVLAGLEIARVFKEAKIQLEHTLEIVDFTGEEASDFGISTIGSRGMVGNLTNENLQLRDTSGMFLKEGIALAGGNPEKILTSARKKGDIALYLELHIEQGPILEQTNNKLGVVTGIVGIRRYRVTVTGKPGHAGTTPMNMRYDALAGAVQIISGLESIAREKYKHPVVGTVGKLSLKPNAPNVIPGEVVFEFEVRSVDSAILDEMISRIRRLSEEVAKERGLDVEFEFISTAKPIPVAPEIQKGIAEVCEQIANTIHLPSGAGHDGNQIGHIAPVGMIFVPSKNGISHNPEEWTEFSDVALGVEALARAIIHFDQNIEEMKVSW